MAAVPASAVITPFANYQAIGTGANLYWKNTGGRNDGSTGTDGSLYTIAANNSRVPGSTLVNFSFLQPSIAPYVTNVTANFTLNASVVNSPATLTGGFLLEQGISGNFSFVTTSAITINSHVFAAGSNLLSGVFTPAAIFGQRGGTSGSFSASTLGGSTITYTSDFLSFTPTISRDFAISMVSIVGVLQTVPTNANPYRALRTFRASTTGSFSSDPAPQVTAVPEPAVWGLMIAGFGLTGVQLRRRKVLPAA